MHDIAIPWVYVEKSPSICPEHFATNTWNMIIKFWIVIKHNPQQASPFCGIYVNIS